MEPVQRSSYESGTVDHTNTRNNQRIHPRNKYANGAPDFKVLAEKQLELQPYITYDQAGRAHLDFTDPAATRALTRALLKNDYEVNWWLPDGHLCPTITNRANYIHWIEDLLQLSSPQSSHRVATTRAQTAGVEKETNEESRSAKESVCGIDIGCGASLIYPLLGASLNHWRFVGTDITTVALTEAAANKDRNPHLAELLEIRDASSAEARFESEGRRLGVTGGGYLLVDVLKPEEQFHFCMCNPPFFTTPEDAARNPHTACEGTPEETSTPGGEEAFVRRLLEDSLQLQERVHWYTTMVGKKSTLKLLTKLLHRRRVPALRTTEFFQGRTSRWGVAWSFSRAAAGTSNKAMPQAGGTNEGPARQAHNAPAQALAATAAPPLPRTKCHINVKIKPVPTAALSTLQRIGSILRKASEAGGPQLPECTASVKEQTLSLCGTFAVDTSEQGGDQSAIGEKRKAQVVSSTCNQFAHIQVHHGCHSCSTASQVKAMQPVILRRNEPAQTLDTGAHAF